MKWLIRAVLGLATTPLDCWWSWGFSKTFHCLPPSSFLSVSTLSPTSHCYPLSFCFLLSLLLPQPSAPRWSPLFFLQPSLSSLSLGFSVFAVNSSEKPPSFQTLALFLSLTLFLSLAHSKFFQSSSSLKLSLSPFSIFLSRSTLSPKLPAAAASCCLLYGTSIHKPSLEWWGWRACPCPHLQPSDDAPWLSFARCKKLQRACCGIFFWLIN